VRSAGQLANAVEKWVRENRQQLAAVASAPPPAQVAASQPLPESAGSGNSFLASCEDADDPKKPVPLDSAGCGSYIVGTVDAALFNAAHNRPDQSRSFCLPERGTYAQYVRVVVKFLRGHPERLQEDRQILVQDALRAAFPCQK
jgi:hypothetical protein